MNTSAKAAISPAPTEQEVSRLIRHTRAHRDRLAIKALLAGRTVADALRAGGYSEKTIRAKAGRTIAGVEKRTGLDILHAAGLDDEALGRKLAELLQSERAAVQLRALELACKLAGYLNPPAAEQFKVMIVADIRQTIMAVLPQEYQDAVNRAIEARYSGGA